MPPWGATADGMPRCTRSRRRGSRTPALPMHNVVRGLVLMIQISLRADTPRTIGTALTAAATRVAYPLRAIGIRALTDGVVSGNLALAGSGVSLVLGLTIVSRLTFFASFNVRMRFPANT